MDKNVGPAASSMMPSTVPSSCRQTRTSAVYMCEATPALRDAQATSEDARMATESVTSTCAQTISCRTLVTAAGSTRASESVGVVTADEDAMAAAELVELAAGTMVMAAKSVPAGASDVTTTKGDGSKGTADTVAHGVNDADELPARRRRRPRRASQQTASRTRVTNRSLSAGEQEP
ncbi:uncharacterized protein IUM83_15548 [Phytophthora cinnamomi]|uniref:uncharacterized protein n=1 Tax=Phytophthora cinnamomi TaxID=4785 RepID=UPI0035595E5A|nr:hypothetical protein IUM83_15548 [Phytophthora cinnamomi]